MINFKTPKMTAQARNFFNKSKYASKTTNIMITEYYNLFNKYIQKDMDEFYNYIHEHRLCTKKFTLKDMKKFIAKLEMLEKQIKIENRLNHMNKDFV